MLEAPEYVQFLGGMVAIVNPLAVLPVFISLTKGRSQAEIHRVGFSASLATAALLLVFLFFGRWILAFFGIHIDSFRVAGGLLILLSALSMLITTLGEAERKQEEKDERQDQRDSIALVPLALPLLAGPGAISTVIVYAHAHHSLYHHLIAGGVIVATAALVFMVFRAGPFLARLLGQTGLHAATRIMGLILAAMAVEFLAEGIRGLFPALS